MRHTGYRIRKDANDNSAVFLADATFCAQTGRFAAGTVSLESHNYPRHHIRHYAAEVWIATNGGSHTWDSPSSYDPDVSWQMTTPWAP